MKAWRLAVITAAMVLIGACSNPEADWKKAGAEGTEEAWQAFLDKHPEGEWAQKAQAQLDGIRDARAWEGAKGLEWTVPSPAPHHTFTRPPVIRPGDLAHEDTEH